MRPTDLSFFFSSINNTYLHSNRIFYLKSGQLYKSERGTCFFIFYFCHSVTFSYFKRARWPPWESITARTIAFIHAIRRSFLLSSSTYTLSHFRLLDRLSSRLFFFFFSPPSLFFNVSIAQQNMKYIRGLHCTKLENRPVALINL